MPFFDPSESSFYQFLTSRYPNYFSRPRLGSESEKLEHADWYQAVPHGTTVLAICFEEGVVIAGDRMATEGYAVASRRIEKVFKTDEYSAMAIAGAAGPCIEMARLFQTELEHYEKIEGVQLSTKGKANKLAQMIKANLPMAMQGLVVVPIFAAYDLQSGEGRIFKYDIAGGQYEETEYYATGSGGREARSTMKKFYKRDLGRDSALRLALEALFDAAEEDIATGGPDFIRGIYPTAKVLTKMGVLEVDEEQVHQEFNRIIDTRRRR